MTEEKGNTIQLEFDIDEAMYPAPERMSDAISELYSRFGCWEKAAKGKFVVTIEFYPDNIDSEVEDE